MRSNATKIVPSLFDNSPMSARIAPYSFATDVFPVPGDPKNTRFKLTSIGGNSFNSRS